MTEPREVESGHLELAAVARYVRGTMAPDERERTERHIADCALCACEIGEVVRIGTRGGRASRWIRVTPLLAAAAALFLIVWADRPRRETGTSRELPVTSAVAPALLPVVTRAGAPPTFRWGSVPRARAYRLVVFDSAGETVFEAEGTDTQASLPDSVRLAPGGLYLWQVEAETATDRRTASGLARFRAGERP